jgi:hypothetical protein
LDLSKLSPGERIVLYAGAALVILSFIPLWASYEVRGFGEESVGGWSGALPAVVKLALVCVLAAVGLAIARVVGANMTVPPITYLALGGAAAVLMLIGLLMGPDDGGIGAAFAELAGLDISRGILFFVGFILTAAVAFGGFMHMQSESASPGVGPSAPPAPPA